MKKRAKKESAAKCSGLPKMFCLFCVIDGAALADDIDLDLAGVIQRVLDLLRDLAGQQDDLIVADHVGLDHDAHFTASLNGKGLFHALEAGRDLLQIFQTLDVALDILAAGTGALMASQA